MPKLSWHSWLLREKCLMLCSMFWWTTLRSSSESSLVQFRRPSMTTSWLKSKHRSNLKWKIDLKTNLAHDYGKWHFNNFEKFSSTFVDNWDVNLHLVMLDHLHVFFCKFSNIFFFLRTSTQKAENFKSKRRQKWRWCCFLFYFFLQVLRLLHTKSQFLVSI